MHAMAYDPIRKQVVLFGGHNGNGADGPQALDDTWLLTTDGHGTGFWTNADIGSLAKRAGHAMVWNPQFQSVMMQGGAAGILSEKLLLLRSEPYFWEGHWTVAEVGRVALYGLAMAFDSSRNTAPQRRPFRIGPSGIGMD